MANNQHLPESQRLSAMCCGEAAKYLPALNKTETILLPLSLSCRGESIILRQTQTAIHFIENTCYHSRQNQFVD
jgi:hypothetical protein